MTNDKIKYTCLFGGGAIRGAAHVGVLKAFKEFGIYSDTLGGSSVGSIVAALYAIGYSHEELKDIFLSVNFELFRDISFGFNTKFALSKGEVFLEWFRELVEKKFYGENYSKGKNEPVRFKDIDKNLVVVSTNMKNFSCCEFSTFATPDFEIAKAVRISCCAPGLMKAVNINEMLLVDGDLMKGKPMWMLSENLSNHKDRILEIRLEGEYTGDDTTPMDYVNGIYSCMTACETDFIKNIYQDHDMYDCLSINTGNAVVFDFNYPPEKRQDIIDKGYRQTVEYLKNKLPVKKQKLYSIYNKILHSIRKVQEYILRKKFSSAKHATAEVFILLSSVNNKIDTNIYKDICQFQKLLFSNVKEGLLGLSRCENIDLVKAQLNLIIGELNLKIKDFDEYFKISF